MQKYIKLNDVIEIPDESDICFYISSANTLRG